jgi:hypothetical protein
MGCSHPTRLSFLRQLLRRLRKENWSFERPVWQINQQGVGYAVYRVQGLDRCYSLVAFSHDLPDEMRSDRVIATAWDATFTLIDGTPTPADIKRLERNVPLQEAGRISEKELSLSRANRSVRLFEYVVKELAQGRQPELSRLEATGYLMRTTAVYGAGKFGAADRGVLAGRPEMQTSFQAEMLSIWLTRAFTVDLVEHLATVRGGERAVKLDRSLRQLLGVGNSTGLGMAPFLVRHPVLLHHWFAAREEALARVRSQPKLTPETLDQFLEALQAAQENAVQWQSEHPLQVIKLKELQEGLRQLEMFVQGEWGSGQDHPWDALWRWGEEELPLEAQEALVALLLEPHGELIDDLGAKMTADEESAFTLDGRQLIGELRSLLESNFAWALETDYHQPQNCARFWYISEEKLEPRLGERHTEQGAEREQPLDIGRQASELWTVLREWSARIPVAQLLLMRPVLRSIVRRVQLSAYYPFAEIQDNLISAEMLPINLLRSKLAFFGATRFDPRSDRWVRVSLFQQEPYPDELNHDVGS